MPRQSKPPAADLPDDADRLEKSIQNDIIAYLVRCGYLVWRNNQGAMFGEHKGKKRMVKFSTMEGISDLQGIIPPRPTGQCPLGVPFFIEVKRPGKKPSKKQNIFLNAARKYGAVAFWAISVQSVYDQLIAAGLHPPEPEIKDG